ncbi:hypothetical protein [Nocardia sp. R6R-6]|uniref:hypothetical protein n=1 Tax=Nocardia sp. R6R-6 TaxID=3459303 RepID=UPI00403DC455
MRISLRVPEVFRTDPDPVGGFRRFHRGGGLSARVWAFGMMAGVAIVLHANGADLVTASGVVVALGTAATQLTTTPLTLTKAAPAARAGA